MDLLLRASPCARCQDSAVNETKAWSCAADSLANENGSVFKYRLRAICWGAGGRVREQEGSIDSGVLASWAGQLVCYLADYEL